MKLLPLRVRLVASGPPVPHLSHLVEAPTSHAGTARLHRVVDDARQSSVASRDSVLFLSASGGLGGAERALLDLVASLRASEEGRPISVLLATGGPLEAALHRVGAEVIVLPMPAALLAMGDSTTRAGAGMARLLARAARNVPRALAYVWRLRRTLRERRPAIIHSNGFKMHVLGALARPAGTHLVWHLHDYTSSRALMARLLRWLAPRCSVAIANSESVAEDARRTLGSRLPVRTVHNAVNLERFAAAVPTDLARAAAMPPAAVGTVLVGLVATMAWWKGHEVFLRALARLPRDAPWRAYVVGGSVYDTAGSQRSIDELRMLASQLGIADRVGFTGFMPDASAVMAALDIVVHASTEPEPFGLVIAEAMATGKPTVVSAAGGATELVVDAEDALTIAPGDVEAMARAIERLVRDPDLRQRLGDAARASARRRFAPERLGRDVAGVHAGLLERPSP